MVHDTQSRVLGRDSHAILIAIAAAAVSFAAADIGAPLANELPDLAAYGRIRDEGMIRSRVMGTRPSLVDGIGPRLTKTFTACSTTSGLA